MYYSTSNNIMIFDKTLDLAVVSNRSIRPIGNHGGCHRHLLSDGSTGSDYNETFPKLRPHHLKGVSLQWTNLKHLPSWKEYDKILNFITYYPRKKKLTIPYMKKWNLIKSNCESWILEKAYKFGCYTSPWKINWCGQAIGRCCESLG